MAKLIQCGVVLRNEINVRWPKRDHESDGWIGDAAHQASKSDHNPDSRGLVHAIDVDKDGIDPHFLVRKAIADSRVEYVIYNRTIWSRKYGFKSREYTGKNPHTSHVHVSFRYGTQYENDTRTFGVKPVVSAPKPTPKPKPTKPGIPKVANGTRVLRRGMRGTDVQFVQRWIGVDDDGIFGPKTEARVEWYQRMRGIKSDGEVGRVTWSHMGVKWKG